MEALERSLESLSLSIPVPEVDAAQVLTNPLDILRVYLANILAEIASCDIAAAYKSIQWPNNIFNGDLAVILPKLQHGAKSTALALELMEKFPKDHPLFLLPLQDGVHFRVFVRPEAMPRLLLPYLLSRKSSYGFDTLLPTSESQKRLVIEFSSPNITSELQGKHLRSTIVGGFISRFYESMGWDVTRLNYLGDWGKPIALLHVGYQKYGSEETYEADPVGHLLEVFHKIEEDFKPERDARIKARDDAVKEGRDEAEAQVEIESKGIYAEHNEVFKKLEHGDEDIVAFWKRVRDVNIENYTKFYDQLGVRFDEYSGESQVSPDTMIEIEQLLKDKNISEESEGAWIVHMQNLGVKAGTAMIRDRSGSSTYLLRDLAAVLERSRKYSFDKMIYVVANDTHAVHFAQLSKILEAMDMKEIASKLQHVKFNDSSKMATSFGKGYKPQVILDACEKAISTLPEIDPEKAALFGGSDPIMKALATSALFGQEVSTRLSSAHTFDTTTMASFKPGSGPDLQYWSARIRYVLGNAAPTTDLSDDDYQPLTEESQTNLLRVLAQYPEVVHATHHSLEPSGIVTYLSSVIEQLSECLEEDKENATITPGHAAMYEATRIVLENGMNLLGITPIAALPPARADTPVAE